jgi:1-acyl-sn-glycerol-3-phosphate acyltransferase
MHKSNSEPPTSNNHNPGAGEKPRTEVYRPDLIRLPRLNFWRRSFQFIFRSVCRLALFLFARCEVRGLENFPKSGPALVVVNHLGDADGILGVAYFPAYVIALAKMELYSFPIVGKVMDAYGVIWVHRGMPDRRALRTAISALQEGYMVAVAPEGRESLTGALEEGTGGAAFLALKANAPILPITFTGTENRVVFANLKKLRRSNFTMTVGELFYLESLQETPQTQRDTIRLATEEIMLKLAAQLPPKYRGKYLVEVE